MTGRRMVGVAIAALMLLPGCTPTPRTTQPVPSATPCAAASIGASGPTPSAPSVAASGGYGPGGPGLGDPYYPNAGNGGYDVASYDLKVRYDPATDTLAGAETITATATANLSQFDLDLHGLTVHTITVNQAAATSSRVADKLVITPITSITKAASFVVAIDYSGVPTSYREDNLGEVGFLNTVDGAVAIGEPEVAASWFAVNDHPSDKATYAITITAPERLSALSNGVLAGKCSANGWTTWSWREDRPMASYLATMVVGDFRVANSVHDGTPVVLAVASSLPPDIDTQLARTPQIIDYLASVFGPYPFDAMGGIVIADKRIRFALENQTRPIYALTFFQSSGDHSWVLAHELAHQWFGDSVSVRDWKQIWLNEGFATYAEWLWAEHNGGQSAQQAFDSLYIQRESPIWAVPPGNPGLAELFGASVYQRGALTLHALRMTVGDTAFFTILRTWAAEKANSTATTEEFTALAERVSGKRLDQFFADWLYGTTIPPRP